MFFSQGDLVSTFCRGSSESNLANLQQWSQQTKKRKQKKERKTESSPRNRIFSRQVTWWGVAIKFSSKVKDCFICQHKEDMMECLRDRPCNVIKIKNNEMIQFFLVERSWNQWSLSKKIFCIRRFREKKMFSEI